MFKKIRILSIISSVLTGILMFLYFAGTIFSVVAMSLGAKELFEYSENATEIGKNSIVAGWEVLCDIFGIFAGVILFILCVIAFLLCVCPFVLHFIVIMLSMTYLSLSTRKDLGINYIHSNYKKDNIIKLVLAILFMLIFITLGYAVLGNGVLGYLLSIPYMLIGMLSGICLYMLYKVKRG